MTRRFGQCAALNATPNAGRIAGRIFGLIAAPAPAAAPVTVADYNGVISRTATLASVGVRGAIG
jgi:hypothetical protein